MRFLIWANSASLPRIAAPDQIGLALFDAGAQQDIERRVAAIVEDHVRPPSANWKMRSA
jgi:hypothetical protein